MLTDDDCGDLEGDEDDNADGLDVSMSMSRDSTSVSESTGGLASNDSLAHLRNSAEPVRNFEQADFDHPPAWLDVDLYLQLLHHFADDLVAVRTKVALSFLSCLFIMVVNR